MKPTRRTILGQPSWRIATRGVEAWLTETGGHLGPVTFTLGKRKVRPYHVAPWANEKLPRNTPPIIKVLRGDFFCMPFGGNATRFGKEQHPVHGEVANARWMINAFRQDRDLCSIDCTLRTRVRGGVVHKHIELRRGHSAIYSRHTISGMSGPMPLGHHAMLRFPDTPGSGLISTSPFEFGQVYVSATELPENRGYSILKPGAAFDSLERVPTITGEITDLSRYPARRGFEDIAMVVADPTLPIAWTAVVFPQERFVWFALRDPHVLRHTIFWVSNGGRHYAPWNGRHVNVLGLEEVTSYFHLGLAESAEENCISRRGYPTALKLAPERPTVVNYIMAVAEIPSGFDRVAEITVAADTVELVSASGKRITTLLDGSFLRGGN